MGGGGRLFEEGDYFKFFHQGGRGGDYSREAIILNISIKGEGGLFEGGN